MKVSVIGCGYLGAVQATCLASLGHRVVGVDVDAERVQALSDRRPPFFEPGLDEALMDSADDERLRFSTDIAAVATCKIHFICVGTPQQQHGISADLTQLEAAFSALLPYLKPGDIVVGKSTVPVGTAEQLAVRVREQEPEATLVWSPEFLREGHALSDTLSPDRIVYGIASDRLGLAAVSALDDMYKGSAAERAPRIVTDYATAQLVKVAANSFLATKISFINAMAELCEATGADVTQLADAIGHDARIGHAYLRAGLGFGGGCLPKDIRAFMSRAGELGVDQALTFLGEVDSINQRRRVRMVELAREVCDGSLFGVRVAVLGAAFKPHSDDVRDSPALAVAAVVRSQGADVVVTDPRALHNAKAKRPDLDFAPTADEAVDGADLVLLLTEWPEYVNIRPERLIERVRNPRILDGRNALDPESWRQAGWHYRALGRP